MGLLDKAGARKPELATVLLRVGLGLVFTYAGIAALAQPLEWQGFIPGFLQQIAPADLLLKAMAVYEICLAVVLFSGKYTKIAALLSALTLGAIFLVSTNQLIVTFRDVGLIFMAVALFFLS